MSARFAVPSGHSAPWGDWVWTVFIRLFCLQYPGRTLREARTDAAIFSLELAGITLISVISDDPNPVEQMIDPRQLAMLFGFVHIICVLIVSHSCCQYNTPQLGNRFGRLEQAKILRDKACAFLNFIDVYVDEFPMLEFAFCFLLL